MRRGVRFPAWYLLLVAVLGILNGCYSLRHREPFAIRHHSALPRHWGLSCGDRHRTRPSLLFPAGGRDGYLLRHPRLDNRPDPRWCSGSRSACMRRHAAGHKRAHGRRRIPLLPAADCVYIAQVTLYSAALGVAISQSYSSTGEIHERAELKQLLGELDLEGVLIQADALHTQKPFLSNTCHHMRFEGLRQQCFHRAEPQLVGSLGKTCDGGILLLLLFIPGGTGIFAIASISD